jgi:hypothetical protein
MSEKIIGNIHWSYWLISALALIWNAMGVMNFFAQMDPDMLATYPQSHRALIETQPVWSKAGFVLSVFGGVIGGILLLLRKTTAFYAFVISLLGTIVVMLHTIGSNIEFSLFDIVLTIAMPLIVAAFLLWYSKWAKRIGWISDALSSSH